MGIGKSSGRPPGLPENAPKDLRTFTECKPPLTLVIDTRKLDWLPIPKEFGEIRVQNAPGDNRGTVSLDATVDALDVDMAASISETGELVLDTSGFNDVPLLGPGIKARVDGWVKAFNDTMKRNNEELESFKIRRGKVTLVKVPVAAGGTETEVGGGTSVTVPPKPKKRIAKKRPAKKRAARRRPAPGPAEESTGTNGGVPWDKIMKALGVGVLVAGTGTGIYFGVTAGNGGDKTVVDVQEVVEDAPATDQAGGENIADEPAPDDAPVEQEAAEQAAENAAPAPVEAEPELGVLAPFDSFTGQLYELDFSGPAQVYDMSTETYLGDIPAPEGLQGQVVFRPDVVGATNVLGFFEGPPEGNLEGNIEVFSSPASGQNGFTLQLGDNELDSFGTPGVGQGTFCNPRNYIFTGTITEFGESNGSYFHFRSADPAGTASTGNFFFDVPREGGFEYVDATGTIDVANELLSDEFENCLNDPAARDVIGSFFAPLESANGAGTGLDQQAIDSILGDAAVVFADGFESGDTTAWSSPGGPGGTRDCQSGDPTDEGPGADLTGLAASVNGSTLTAHVFTAQPPAISEESFSFAVSLQVVPQSRELQEWLWENHGGVPRIGRAYFSEDEDSVIPDGDITIDDSGVHFRVEIDPIDPNDPLLFLSANGFNTVVDGQPTVCDQLIGIADPFPFPTDPTRFPVGVIGPSGPLTAIETALTDGALFSGPDGAALVRVINACAFSDHFWVWAAATTNVEFGFTVTDTVTSEVQTYTNPLGTAAEPITDTSAFATCP